MLAVRLEALRPGDSTTKAVSAVREARADQAAAVVALRAARARKAGVRADSQLGDALDAEGTYLATVSRVLRHPRSRVASELKPQAKRAQAAFAALPDAGGVTETIRGARRLAAYAHAARG